MNAPSNQPWFSYADLACLCACDEPALSTIPDLPEHELFRMERINEDIPDDFIIEKTLLFWQTGKWSGLSGRTPLLMLLRMKCALWYFALFDEGSDNKKLSQPWAKRLFVAALTDVWRMYGLVWILEAEGVVGPIYLHCVEEEPEERMFPVLTRLPE